MSKQLRNKYVFITTHQNSDFCVIFFKEIFNLNLKQHNDYLGTTVCDFIPCFEQFISLVYAVLYAKKSLIFSCVWYLEFDRNY